MSDRDMLLSVIQKLFEHDVEAAANILEAMAEEEAAEIFRTLPTLLAVRVIKHLQVSYAAALLKGADDMFLQAIASLLGPQFAATILMHLPHNVRERLTKSISIKLKEEIRELLEYPEGSIGRIMTTDFLSFREDIPAEEAIERIRLLAQKRLPLSYAYVVDEDCHLIGVLNMRDLMLASRDKPLESIMRREIFSLHGFTDRQEAAKELSKRKYFAAPVVDGESRIVGIVKAERLIQGVQEDITKDIQKMFGAGGDERVFSSIVFSLKKRLPWLHINLATAFLAAGVVALFEGIIAKLTILAVFLPVVAGQGGNAGAQSLAVVMRGIPKGKFFSLIYKEGKVGAVNGAVIGSVTALVAWVWNGSPYLGLVIGLGMLFNLFLRVSPVHQFPF